MNTWKVILVTMVIFGTGVVTGGLLVRNSERVRQPHPEQKARVNRTGQSPGGMRLEFLRRAQRDLNLSPAQREQVDKILKESQERTRKVMEPVSPLLRQEVERARAEFTKVLTPEQKARFAEIMKQQQRAREAREKRDRPAETKPAAQP